MGVGWPINYVALYQKAVEIATKAHKGQTRWDPSIPYITHPLSVAENFDLKDQGVQKIVAVLHDVIEDTDVTAAQLRDVFPDWMIKPLEALTHRENESYVDYICRVNDDNIAAAVKMADIKDNLKGLTEKKHRQRKDKYELALKLLELRWERND